MPAYYSELRPAYTGEASYLVTVTIAGAGSIAGQTFAAALTRADGSAAAGTPAASVSDAAARKVLVTLPGQTVPGDYVWRATRTDDGSNLVVAHGLLEVTDPAKP